MKELEELIQFWKDDMAINWIHRNPQHNEQILCTIKYLETLKQMSTLTNSQLSFHHPLAKEA